MKVNDELRGANASAPDKGTPSAGPLRLVRLGGAVYYVVTGIWPLLHMPSFELVTGRKRDRWLVQTVGALVAVIGAAQLSALRRRPPPELRGLSAGVALALATVELFHWRRGTISLAYALDALGELLLAAAWAAGEPAARGQPVSGPAPPRRDARPSPAAPAAAFGGPAHGPGRARC